MALIDFIPSGKVRGWIGLLTAVAVVGGALVLWPNDPDSRFHIPNKKLQEAIRNDASRVAELRENIKMNQDRLEVIAKLDEIAKKLEATNAELQAKLEFVKTAKANLPTNRQDLLATEQELQAYKTQYRNAVREKAAGTTLVSLTTLDGITYHEVKINRVNTLGINLSHRDGSARIPFAKLPMAMQELYQFNPDEANSLVEAEAVSHQQTARSEAAAAEADKAQNQLLQQQKDRDSALKKEQAIATLTARLDKLVTDIQNFEDSISREAQKKISRAPQMREQLTAMKQAKHELELKLRQVESAP